MCCAKLSVNALLMKNPFFYFLLLIGMPLSGQDYALPAMSHYQVATYFWADSSSTQQITYWPNGQTKVQYADLAADKKRRSEYDEQGCLLIEIEVKQHFTVDTILHVDPETFEEELEIRRGFTDMPHGSYTEYVRFAESCPEKPIVLTEGQYQEGLRFGLWKTCKEKIGVGALLSAHYNAEGQLEGEFMESYAFLGKPRKIVGHYQPVKIVQLQLNLHPGGHQLIERTVIRRVGTWQYFDLDGVVLEEVTYDWKRQ